MWLTRSGVRPRRRSLINALIAVNRSEAERGKKVLRCESRQLGTDQLYFQIHSLLSRSLTLLLSNKVGGSLDLK